VKQKDIALILVISFVSLIFGVVASNLLFNTKNSKKLKADVVTAITSDFKEPDKKYFNSNSVDPTQIIRIGENANQKPFNQ
jgi:hypothetical protein